MTRKRVTITISAELLKRADQEARRLDRSRSWVVADALDRALAGDTAAPTTRPKAVHEPLAPWNAEFSAARTAHLAADLKLTPEERAHRLAEMDRFVASAHARTRPRRAQVLGFDSYVEFYAWKTRRRIAE